MKKKGSDAHHKGYFILIVIYQLQYNSSHQLNLIQNNVAVYLDRHATSVTIYCSASYAVNIMS